MRKAFRTQETRTQRSSDGTISVGGIRFEVPNRYRTLRRPTVHFARWDLSCIDLIDPRTGAILCPLHPLDKRRNADGRRRVIENPGERRATTGAASTIQPAGIAPHLQQLMRGYAAARLPPAYLPMTDKSTSSLGENDS